MNLTQLSTSIPAQLKSILSASLLVLAGCLISPNDLVGQDDAKALIKECIAAQDAKFTPLKLQSDAMYSKFSNQSSAARDVIRWLEDEPSSAEQKWQMEVDRLKTRLEILESLQPMTLGESLKDVKGTIKKVQTLIDDIGDDRAIALRPIERARTELQREYQDREDQLEPIMEGLCFEKGQNELTSSLMRSYASFTYSTAQTGGQYKESEAGSVVCTVRIYLDHARVADPKLGMLDDKYPIVAKRDTQIEILVGSALVEIYSSNSKFKKDNLGKALTGLVDFDKLASLLTNQQ